jgi:hypothetical protein
MFGFVTKEIERQYLGRSAGADVKALMKLTNSTLTERSRD